MFASLYFWLFLDQDETNRAYIVVNSKRGESHIIVTSVVLLRSVKICYINNIQTNFVYSLNKTYASIAIYSLTFGRKIIISKRCAPPCNCRL